MAFATPLSASCPVFDDSTKEHEQGDPVVNGEPMSRGHIERDFSLDPFCGVGAAFPSELLIPESEWEERIREQEEQQSSLYHLLRYAGWKVKNQNGTNYCWINAPVAGVEAMRIVQGHAHVELSPASVGAKIKNFANVGGWGTEGLRYIIEHGLVPASLWPCNGIKREYDTPEANAQRENFRVQEWYDLRPRNIQEHISCLLRRIPVAVGLNYWGHEVLDVQAVWVNGRIGTRFANSWSESWGEQGYGVRQGSKMPADDATCPAVVNAS